MNKETLRKWYYVRGLKSLEYRKLYFYKHYNWLWSNELYEKEIPLLNRILYVQLKPVNTPLLTLLANKGNKVQLSPDKYSWFEKTTCN